MVASLQFDIHTHTIASGHGSTSTITDMARAAASKKLRLLGISDHGPATRGGASPSYFRSLFHAPRHRLGIEMMYGAEADIINNEGKLDLENKVLAGLDYVIASMHKTVRRPGTPKENTAAYIAAMKNPYVRIIGHCDDVNFPVDYHALVAAARDEHVLLEINNSSLSPDGYRGDTRFNDSMLLNLCRHYHYPVIFGSDSHGTGCVGEFGYALDLAGLADMPKSLILNYSLEAFWSFLSSKA